MNEINGNVKPIVKISSYFNDDILYLAIGLKANMIIRKLIEGRVFFKINIADDNVSAKVIILPRLSHPDAFHILNFLGVAGS